MDRYEVVWGPEPRTLANAVNKRLEDGWCVHGPMVTVPRSDNDFGSVDFFQPMMFFENKKEKLYG